MSSKFAGKFAVAIASVVLMFALVPAVAFADLQAGDVDDGQSDEPGTPLTAQSANVSNPRVVTDSTMEAGQRTTWDCVWFGSYPQTEVTSSDAVYSKLQSAGWDASGNATVGGVKYKRISRNDATSSSNWPSSSGTYRYFKYEPIKWRVLSVSGTKAFVVSDVALDSQYYNTSSTAVSWNTSSIRSWLNGYGSSYNQPGVNYASKNFIGTAFSPGEQSVIYQTSAVSYDKVFLLSHDEVSGNAATAYGFSKAVRSETFIFEDRMCEGSDFAAAMGAVSGADGYVYWWIRLAQLSNAQRYADVVGDSGRVYENVGTALVSYYTYGVRPALNLDLSSSYVTYAGTVSTKGDSQKMHRLYNPNSGEHFYTASVKERDGLKKLGWRYEGVGWTAPATSGTPVYRLYNANAGDHHYTTSAKERDNLVKAGWKYEGIGWYSDDAKGKPLYRQYNPNARTGTHNYTTSKNENDKLVKLGWKYEGIGWYGVA